MGTKELDRIQKEFIELYREIENGGIQLKPLANGNDSLWSTSAMFDLTPLHIERSWGNLRKEKVLTERPISLKRISEGIYNNNEMICAKFWKEDELQGFANYFEISNGITQSKRVVIDDDEQELTSISYYHKNKEGLITKMIKAHRSGATLEEYEYTNSILSRITIQRRDEFEVMDNPDGITKASINKIVYVVEYNSSGELIGIINEKGENVYRKPKYKKMI
ncbi:hypothetical protein [Aquimarina sp. 2201CG14-23]|uniref:hypothetical protein n=1 Tax=Aquimarina mycalae TaxID=3040073 RepID=UPI002477E52D|nr:hypothetical protein [Aquimarina sp. 2201CG14-23]MDH7447615.1 hypothetical protein [Aquimarina sp. 2201CG14-23]